MIPLDGTLLGMRRRALDWLEVQHAINQISMELWTTCRMSAAPAGYQK